MQGKPSAHTQGHFADWSSQKRVRCAGLKTRSGSAKAAALTRAAMLPRLSANVSKHVLARCMAQSVTAGIAVYLTPTTGMITLTSLWTILAMTVLNSLPHKIVLRGIDKL